MMESIVRATCPQCQSSLRIPAKWLGQAVKCKNCGAMVRTKAKSPTANAAPDDTAPNAALPASTPVPAVQPAPFDFSKQDSEDDGLFQLPQPNAAPAPAFPPMPHSPALDANGYPLPGAAPAPAPAPHPYGAPQPGGYPAPPGYPPPGAYAPPPGYPYAPPPGYGYNAPPPGAYPPAPVPGYPQPTQTGYAPPPSAYPQPAMPQPAVPAPATATRPAQGTRPATKPQPVGPSNEFKLDTAAPTSNSPRRKYKRGSNASKFIWIGFSLLLTAGLIAGGVYFVKQQQNNEVAKEKETPKDDKDKQNPNAQNPPKVTNGAFPRRILFMSVSRYMYLNPLTTGSQGIDRTASVASNLGFVWRVPVEKENNQLFVLSDTAKATMDRLPMKNVIQGTYQEFCKTSRPQDRVLIYFGGHAIEKGGKAYLAPMEAELDGDEWEKTVIPLEHFYDEVKKCKATQKVVVWDVCRYNPERGRVRPGSEPMSEALFKALTSPPPGIQVITTCKAGENALEFSQLRPEGLGVNAPVYSGSVFLESLKYVGSPANKAMPKVAPTQTDPLPIADWFPMIAKRVNEMCEIGEKLGNGGKQTVTLVGTPPASLVSPDGSEKVAARFEFPQAPKGTSQTEIRAVEREFLLPPLKPDLASVNIGDFPFPADVMKDFGTDVNIDEITKDKEKYKLRNAVLDTFNILRTKWSTGAGTTNIRNKVEGGVNDTLKAEVKREQDFWATSIAELELQLLTLEGVASLKESETKRWQANYDFALASLKARLAYMNEYNKLLGNLITETIPALDAKLGQDGYILAASETLKSGKDVKKMAEEAQTLFAEIATKYKGTPWAIQAKQEKTVAIGLTWKAASLKEAKPEP